MSRRGAPELRTRVPDRRHRLFSTPIDGEEKWNPTGTVNPGLICAGKFIEIAADDLGAEFAAAGDAVDPLRDRYHRDGAGVAHCGLRAMMT